MRINLSWKLLSMFFLKMNFIIKIEDIIFLKKIGSVIGNLIKKIPSCILSRV